MVEMKVDEAVQIISHWGVGGGCVWKDDCDSIIMWIHFQVVSRQLAQSVRWATHSTGLEAAQKVHGMW